MTSAMNGQTLRGAVSPLLKSREHGYAALAVAAAGFVGVAALSYLNRTLAVWALLAWSVLTIVSMPIVGWAFTMFAVVFQDVFALGADDFRRIRYALLLVLVGRLGWLVVQRRMYRSPLLWCLLAFTALVGLHDVLSGSSAKQAVWDAGVLLSLAGVYVVSREFGRDPAGATLGAAAMVLAAFLSAALSFAFLYLPLPGLIALGRLPDSLRLFGVQDNPNSLAQLLVPALLILVCASIGRQRSPGWVALVATAGVLLAATGTRAGLLVVAATLFVLLPLVTSPGVRRTGVRVVALPLVALLGCAVWLIGVAPWVEHRAAQQWIARSDAFLCVYLEARSGHDPCDRLFLTADDSGVSPVNRILDTFMRDLRLQASHAMFKVDGRTTYVRRAFRISEMGQRDRTWRAGLTVVSQHWLWGFAGREGWAQHMQVLTGYPFTSPHNGVLEVTGAYGVLGLLLYVSVIVLFVRNYLDLRQRAHLPWQRAANEWVFLCGAAVFLFELTDALTVLAFSIHAIWFWGIVGMQAGLLDAAAAERPAAAPAAEEAERGRAVRPPVSAAAPLEL